MIPCPQRDQLEALLAERLARDERLAIEDHVETCTDCQSLLETLCPIESVYEAAGVPADHDIQSWSTDVGKRLAQAVHQSDSRGGSSPFDEDTPLIPGHEILEFIGRGGMGRVYRGRQLDLNREVAIKLLDACDSRDVQQLTKRFADEAQVTANLDHPSIVPVHGIGHDESGSCFYTMRLVCGHELRDVWRLASKNEEGWSYSRAVSVLVRVCQAIAFAHAHGVIHRDLKPANIMVGDLGEVYVLDWGLAKATGQEDMRDLRPRLDETDATELKPTNEVVSSHHGSTAAANSDTANPAGEEDRPLVTMDGAIIGTPAYMSPEQAAGESKSVDQLSDVYALGSILYQLLTGQPPYDSDIRNGPAALVLRGVLAGPPTSVARLAPESPPELIAICEKAMARERGERYETALEMAEDLQAYLDDRVVKAHRTGAMAEAKKWILRNRGTAATGILAILLTVVGLMAYGWLQWTTTQDLAAANQVTAQALGEQQRVSGKLVATNNQLSQVNAEVTLLLQRESEARASATEAKDRASAAAESERIAKVEAFALLADSYANYGEQEATKGNYSSAALWFAEAAELCDAQPDIQHTHRMRAMQFSRAAPTVVAADWDRSVLKSPDKPWPGRSSQFLMHTTGRYLITRGSAPHWRNARILDLWNKAEPLWNRTSYQAAAFSPDRKHIAVSNHADRVVICKLRSGQETRVLKLPGHQRPIRILEYSHNGNLLFIGASPARIWNIGESRFLDATYDAGGEIVDMGFSADDQQILICSSEGAPRLYDVVDQSGAIDPIETAESDAQLQSRFTLRQRRTHASDSPIKINPVVLAGFGYKGSQVGGAATNPARSVAATYHSNGVVRVWREEPQRPYWYILTDGWARPIFSPDSLLVASVGHVFVDRRSDLSPSKRKPELLSTQVYDSASGQPVGPVVRVDVPIINGCFSPDSKTLALACSVPGRSMESLTMPNGRGGSIQFWDWKSAAKIGESLPMPSEPQAVAWHPTRDVLVVGCASGEVMTVNPVTRQSHLLFQSKVTRRRYLRGPGQEGECGVAFDSTGSRVLWWGFGGQQQVLELQSGEVYYMPSRSNPDYWTVGLESHDDTLVIACVENRPVVSNMKTRTWLATADGGQSIAHLSQDGELVLATGPVAQRLVVWDISAREMTCPQFGFGSRDGHFIHNTPFVISTGGANPCWIRFWDYRTGRTAAPTLEIPGSEHSGFVRVSNDGKFAAMSCWPHGIAVCDLRSFHEDPLQGLVPGDLEMLAEINSGAWITNGRLVRPHPTDETKRGWWIERWDTFASRYPDFHDAEIPRELAVRHHQTRAYECGILGLPKAVWFHRWRATALSRKGTQVDSVRPIGENQNKSAAELAKLNRAVDGNPSSRNLTLRAQFYMRSRKWERAVQDLGEIVRLQPEESLAWMRLIAACARAGDQVAYKRNCDEMLARFRNSSDPVDVERVVKSCLLLPGVIDLSELPVGSIDQALKSKSPSSTKMWCLLARALYACRSEDAVTTLDSCNSVIRNPSTDTQRALAHVVIALSGSLSDSTKSTNVALDRVRPLLGAGLVEFHRQPIDEPSARWQDWIIADILYQEARQAISARNNQ